jgi:membrane protein DedA with SNARE-associated domain
LFENCTWFSTYVYFSADEIVVVVVVVVVIIIIIIRRRRRRRRRRKYISWLSSVVSSKFWDGA